MNRTILAIPTARLIRTALVVSAIAAPALWGQAAAPNKVGIIHIQNAIVGTKDGQKAAADLQARFAPKKAELEGKQKEIEALRAQLAKGSTVMSTEQKESLMRDIDQKTKTLNRSTEDAQAELDQEQSRIMQDLGQRILAVIDKYSKDNGYSLILDISSQASPVIFATNTIDITRDIVELYDKNAPQPVSSGGAPASPAPAKPAPAKPVSAPAAAAPKR